MSSAVVNKELIDIGSMVKQAIAVTERTTEDRVSFDVHIPLDTVHLYGDRSVLAKAFQELFRNAVSHSRPVVQVRAVVKEGGTRYRIFIGGDPSAGNEQEERPLIAEMEAVQRMLASQGGGLSSFNTENKIIYAVELPLAVLPRAIERSADMGESEKCKIPVVDDNVDGAVTLSVILNHLGHSVRVTHDGTSAIAVAQEFKPELILMDIGMPGLDGYETCERMRKEDWSAGSYIVALTGWGQEEDKRKAKRAGFDKHLVKPVDRKTLMEVVASAKQGRKAEPGAEE